MDDLIDGKGRCRSVRIVAIPRRQFLGNAVQPLVEQCLRSGIERGESPDDSRLALGDHQIGHRDDEQRGPDHGQPQAIEQGGQAHTDFIAQPACLSSKPDCLAAGRP